MRQSLQVKLLETINDCFIHPKGREGKGREGKGREGKGREGKTYHRSFAVNSMMFVTSTHLVS